MIGDNAASIAFSVTLLLSHVYGYSLQDNDIVLERSRAEINRLKGTAERIIAFQTQGGGRNQTYDRLAQFVDKFGSRIAGSRNLENAIDFMLAAMAREGLENVHGEPAQVPHWVRGQESAEMLLPRRKKLAMLGLGSSVATPPQGITAKVLVVQSFEELKTRASEAKGRVVVYNQPYVSYDVSVAYRTKGATEAARVGAVASLIRSVTDFSLNTPHTGWQAYEDGVDKIPTACITVEDAEMMWRMAKRGDNITVRLYMEAQNLPPVMSRNTIAEIKGYKYPHQVVLVSGHLDSWDVGQGAMDDGGGAFISYQALLTLRQLGLRPKRTLRAILWTGEEEGLWGGQAYWNNHKVDKGNFSIVMENDIGTFRPLGIDFNGNKLATKIMAELVGTLLRDINATKLREGAAELPDLPWWMNSHVPAASLNNANDKYFYFHHTDADTMTVEDAHSLDLCSAVWAVVAYALADMEDMLPR